ncbi:hypothetical protein MW871_11135 [Flavobacterium sp. I-SCBP12n]|uniref:Trimeric autotransporter adhesin YadA-like stalk domain-containing protein n=1 Tax=Flavobacterium pygoscelis TaxID=2893176 RepID=A0A9X1XTL4_9FLAO|nr:hypothetical protein [Flavobacterium pygoscelis]MCK8142446.1 hypothetical protein [Flavobacterium pygoscelis]
MKKIYLILVFIVSTIAHSQTNGISYQALILNPNAQKMPGINPPNTALINQSVCLQFSIEDETQQLEYKETISAVTDEMGMVNLVIGLGNQTGGYAINFKAVNWISGLKKLKVGVNITGNCSSFMEVSDQVFNAVPFAFSAQTVSGIVGIENGGTNASNIVDAKINLILNNVDNTRDFDKPISNATQSVLDLKEVLLNKSTNVIVDGSSDVKYPTVKALKTYVDNQFSNGVVVDADATNKGKIQLSGDLAGTASLPKVPGLLLKANINSPAFTGTVTGINKAMVGLSNVENTADADKLISTATQTALNLKANIDSPAFTGTITGIDKAMVGLSNVENTADADKSVSTATQTALNLKANIDSPTFTGTVTGIDKVMVGLSNVENTADADKLISTATQTALNLKANINSPTFTGTVTGINKAMVGLSNVENTADADKSVSTATQTALNLKANIDSPTFTGTVTGINKAMVGLSNVENTADVDKLVSLPTQTALNLKANINSPAFTGTVTGIDKAMVGLTNVENTADADKSVSNATQTALNLKANIDSPAFTGTVTGIDKAMVGLSNVENTADADKSVSTATQTVLNLKANIDSPTFTGTVTGIDKAMVGLSNVENTADADKSVSTATQTVLNLKANIDSPSFTGTVTGIDKAMVGLSNVENTADADKSVSTATQTALNLKANIDSPSFTGTPNLPATTIAATQSAGNNSTAIATTAFVGDALNTAINGNFVDIISDQTIAGTKTFSNSIQIQDQLRFLNSSGAVKWELYSSGDDISFSQSGVDFNQFMVKSNGEVSSRGSMTVNESGVTGKGLILSDDGDFVDMNDGYGTLRFSSGVKVTDANKGGATVITLGANGRIEATNQIVAGEVTYTNIDGTIGQVLATDGSGITYWMTPTVPTNNDFVDLTTAQTILGVKSFDKDMVVNGITIGRGNFNENSNTAIGLGALQNNAGYANTAVGRAALPANADGNGNTAYGYLSLGNNVSGNNNVAIGSQALLLNTNGSENTVIGHNADVSVDGISNSIAIGFEAIVTTSNTIQLGNSNIENVKTTGTLTSGAITYTNTDGTTGQVLSTNGAGTTVWVNAAHEITDASEEILSTLSQTTFTLSQIPSTKSKVKMYVNGIRISNTAYSVTNDVLTYIPANNGNAILSDTDRIQFDYFY